jgi:hypothetical protein
MRNIIILIIIFSLYGCDKGAKTPEGLIKKYVSDITSRAVDKDFFEKHTAGELWDQVSALGDDDFRKFVDLNKIKNPKIEISNKVCAGDKCTLTYIIRYDVVDGADKIFRSEVKKVATVERFGEIWKILDVTNIKTYHESTEPIEALK